MLLAAADDDDDGNILINYENLSSTVQAFIKS